MSNTFITYSRCEFPLANHEDVAALIEEKIRDQLPVSIIRLGDGEGAMLAHPDPLNHHLWSHKNHFFGRHISVEEYHNVAALLKEAILRADVVGVRDDIINVDFSESQFDLSEEEFLTKFQSSFHLRDAERDISYPTALRIASLHRSLSALAFSEKTIFCSAWVHFMLSRAGALARILKKQECIGLISSRPALVEILKDLFGVEVDYWEVPHLEGNDIPRTGVGAHYPEFFCRTMETLHVRNRGQLFLVGGSAFGKLYCQRVKEMGGIGLDIGSVCDAWINIPSRPLVFRSMFTTDQGVVPKELLLNNQIDAMKRKK